MQVLLELYVHVFQQFQEGHDWRVQELIADPPDYFGQAIHKFRISLKTTFDFAVIQEQQPFLRLLFPQNIIEANLQIATVVKLTDLLKLLLYVFEEFYGVFIARVAVLIQFVIGLKKGRVVIVGFEVEDIIILECNVWQFDNNEGSDSFSKNSGQILIDFDELGSKWVTFS